MKTYNALSKSFTDEVKTIMGEGKTIDEAFEDVKTAIIDYDSPTPTPEPTIYEYVDLGLPSGTMWATCNVGATKPEEYGLLFQFGRVDGYAYGDTNNQFVENNETSASGKTYNSDEILDLVDDAANVNMGGKWRMPTGSYTISDDEQVEYSGELGELINNTTHEVVTINGVKGMMFTSNINSNQLFIPFAGFWISGDGSFIQAGNGAFVWSSQVANLLWLRSDNSADIRTASKSGSSFNTSFAYSVRGVFKK